MGEKAAWVREYEAGWARELPRLREQGYAAELTCFAAPVQLEGTLNTGEPFYFRCRHEHCQLWIGEAGDDPLEHFKWTEGVPWGSKPEDASYIPPAEAIRTLLELTSQYRRRGENAAP